MGDPNIVAGLPVAQCATRPGSLPDVRARLSELRRTRPPTMTIALDDIDGADEAISVLAEIEAAKAWLDRLSVTAAGALLSWSEDRTRADLNHYGATATERAQTMTHARTSIIDEICLATGLARGDATARAETGVLARREPDRTTSALAALTTGQIGWWRARTIITGCTPLPADQANDVASAVLRPTRDGTTPSPRLIADRLAKELKKRIPGRVRRAEALSRRDTSVRLGDDDTATLGIGGSTERVTAAHDRLDRLARRLRHAGDPRTLAQLRADIGLDLLLHGHSPALCDTTDPAPRRTAPCTPPAPDHANHTTGDPTGDTTGDTTGAALRAAYPGGLPDAHATVIVPLSSLLGLTSEPGELVGWGYLPADLTRDLAVRAGSVWARLITDPRTGQALELSTPCYRPTAAMARFITARDHRCRAPGCTSPATTGDLDHVRPFADGGETSTTNLAAHCRRHHGHHTSGHWSPATAPGGMTTTADADTADGTTANAVTNANGPLTWSTQTGRRYTTEPHRYSDPDTGESPDATLDGRPPASGTDGSTPPPDPGPPPF